MTSSVRLGQLLQDPRIWQAGHAAGAAASVLASGWPRLDEALGGGWPHAQLTELLVDGHGLGEVTLLLPALRELMRRHERDPATPCWIAFVAPPYLPYAPALAQAGVDLARFLLVRPREPIDTFWAMEQALQARSCAAVIGWSELARYTPLRRLQLAAAAGGAWTVLFRPVRLRAVRSPAPLRLQLHRESPGTRLRVEVLKQRGAGTRMASVPVDVDG
jgi:hypothetical protein